MTEQRTNHSTASFVIPKCEVDNCSYVFRKHYTTTAQEQELFFSPQFVGHYVCCGTYRIDRIMPYSFLLLFTISGSGELHYLDKSYSLAPGKIMFINCANHHCYFSTNDRWEFKYIHFRGAMSESYYNYIYNSFSPVFKLTSCGFLKVISIIDAIFAEIDKTGFYSCSIISGYIYSLLTLMISDVGRGGDMCGDQQVSRVTQASEYIREHYKEAINIESLAKQFYMSRSYFSTLFKRICGASPHEYITAYRMDQAKMLLTESYAGISEIAQAVGFQDISTFTRLFVKCNQITPSKYRAMFGPNS